MLSAEDAHAGDPPTPIPITVTPASPAAPNMPKENSDGSDDMSNEKHTLSPEDGMSRGKKVREVLKNRVHKGQAGITRISKKIGHNVGKHGSLHMKRTHSAPGRLISWIAEFASLFMSFLQIYMPFLAIRRIKLLPFTSDSI